MYQAAFISSLERASFVVCYFLSFFLFSFSGRLHMGHMEVPGLGVELELQLLACTTATPIRATSATGCFLGRGSLHSKRPHVKQKAQVSLQQSEADWQSGWVAVCLECLQPSLGFGTPLFP